MASVDEVDINSQETGPARRSKNVAKRGRRKRGASIVSTRSTRSKKPVPNSQESEEEEEEEVEDNSQDDQETSAEADASDSKIISLENDVLKNGVEETGSPETNKTDKIPEEKNLESSSPKQKADVEITPESKDKTEPESSVKNKKSTSEVKDVADEKKSTDEKTDGVKGKTSVEEGKVKENKVNSNNKVSETEVVVVKDTTTVAEDKMNAAENDSVEDKEATTKDEVVMEEGEAPLAEGTAPSAEDTATSAEDKPPSVKGKGSSVEEKAPSEDEKAPSAEDESHSANDEAQSADDKIASTEDKPAPEVTDNENVSSDATPSSENVEATIAETEVPSTGGDCEKQNDKDVDSESTVTESAAPVASAHTKPPDTSSVGSPLEVDISQYTVLEETNTSQGSPDKGDEPMEVDEQQVDDKKEREQSPEAGDMKNASMDDMTIIDEVEDEGDEKDESREGKTTVKSHVQLDDTEMVSEDELPTETAKEPETEAVSDEELPEPAAVSAGDLPETEEVSEDELPPEKTEKKKKNSEVETPKETETTADQAKKKRKSRFEGQKRKLAEGDTYDPSSPTSENSCDETPAAKRAALSSGSADKAKQSTKGRKTLPELDKYWKAVKEDASDFTGWTYLLQYVDQENDIDAAREAYDAFLSHYPYCYGYWRKYADYEKRKGNKEKCEEVFDRGLKAIPLSVDLWIHYLHYCKTTFPDNEEFLRAQFERALTACGMEFRSDRLWESYIKWETEGKRIQNVTAVYDRLLNMPTQGYTSHFENFQEHISNNAPQKVLSVDEFLSLRREVLQLLKQYDSPGAEEAVPGEEAEAPPGEEPEETPSVSDEETTALRERIVSLRRKFHKATVTAVADRWNFEEGIKRPYFHVKPLERCQLKNWKEYLDFEIEKGDKERIITLFERCLIACALYEEFWLKFVRYLESEKNDEMSEKIRDVYERACTIHHPKKPNLHLHWSVFEESHKNYDKAADILTNLEKAVPNLVQVSYRRINLERRRGNPDKVCSLYDHYINTSKNKVIANNMAIKYARFCWKVKGDVEKAISVLNKALDKDKENPRLYLQLIDMGMQRPVLDEAEIISTIDLFLSRDVDPEQKVLFAQRKVEFLEDFSSDIVSVQKSHDEFLRYCKQIKERKKKSAEEVKSESASKKSKSGSGDSTSQHATHTGAQSHTNSPATQPASGQGAASQYTNQSYSQGNYSQAPPAQGGYQGGQYTGSQPGPYSQAPYNQQYSQSGDPNYANYQNWGYSQPGYGGYNQGWGNYNYY